MKIVSKNRTNIIAVHDGMPFVFNVEALNGRHFLHNHTTVDSCNVVGKHIDVQDMYEVCDVVWGDEYHHLLKRRLEDRLGKD